MDDEASDRESDKNAKGKELCLEDPESEERGYHVEITYTEASEDFLLKKSLHWFVNNLLPKKKCFLPS